MMNLNFQNKYTNSGHRWKVVDKKGLYMILTRTHMVTKRDKKEL